MDKFSEIYFKPIISYLFCKITDKNSRYQKVKRI